MPSRSIRQRDLRRLFIATSVLLAGLALAGLAHAAQPAGGAKASLRAEPAQPAQAVNASGARPD